MSRTEFRNASGLANRRQLSTARDMATLARALIRDFPQNYAVFSTKTFTYKGRAHRNHNRLLRKYPGVDGIKTGYIRASGFNLAASATRGGRRLIAVVLGGKSPRSRDRRVAKLLDRGFADLASRNLWASGNQGKRPAPPARKPSSAMAVAGIDPTGTAGPERFGPTPKAGRVETGSAANSSRDRIWGVQVGAYYQYKPALRAARAAARRAPDILTGTRENVSTLKGRRGRLYRARLVGLSRSHAGRACRRLETIKIDCLVVKVGRRFALIRDERRIARN
jgi:D-alanyl-D-alanine carboxypeptidase